MPKPISREKFNESVRSFLRPNKNGKYNTEEVTLLLRGFRIFPCHTTDYNGWEFSGPGPMETVYVFSSGAPLRMSVQNSWNFSN